MAASTFTWEEFTMPLRRLAGQEQYRLTMYIIYFSAPAINQHVLSYWYYLCEAIHIKFNHKKTLRLSWHCNQTIVYFVLMFLRLSWHCNKLRCYYVNKIIEFKEITTRKTEKAFRITFVGCRGILVWTLDSGSKGCGFDSRQCLALLSVSKTLYPHCCSPCTHVYKWVPGRMRMLFIAWRGIVCAPV